MAISVFPEQMDPLNREDTQNALGTVEAYIHYMVERVEFSLSNYYKTLRETGTSTAEVVLILAAHEESISQLNSQILLKADKSVVNALDARVDALEEVISATGPILIQNAEDVTAAEGDDAIFSVRALGTNLTYKWELYYSSSWTYPNFQGRDTPNMTVPATVSRNLYRFRCTITGGGWTVVSRTVTLTVTS